MKIVVIGAGAVGLTATASLTLAGAEVFIVARGKSLDVLRTGGIRVTGVLGENFVPSAKFHVLDAREPLPLCDGIIVATKAAGVVPALQSMGPGFGGSKPFVLLVQNGWGLAEEAKALLPAGTPIFSASLMTGIEYLAPAVVRVNAHGNPVRIGSLFGDNSEIIMPLIDLSQQGFWPFAYDQAIQEVLLIKLLFSLCMNPLGAILDATYGELAANLQATALMEKLATEAIHVIKVALGVSLYKDGSDYVGNDPMFSRVKSSPHRSSMLQDIVTGRKTEITYINAAISKMGRECGVATPYNDTIVDLIMALEAVEKGHDL